MPKKRRFIFITSFILVILITIFIGISRYYPFFQFFTNRDIALKKENNSINILLLGVGGGTHEGPDLTDTIIFASLDLKKDKVNLVSIPRDLWIPDYKGKINLAYHLGEVKQKGGGIILTKAVIEKILNQPINYIVLINFEGFVQAVDLMDDIDVEVEKSFDDFEYPIEGKENDNCGHTEEEVQLLSTSSAQLEAFPCRYMRLHFDAGLQHMDGNTALQFVRSRHAKGKEGSDFARSKRQEKVIKAFKDKMFSLQILLNPVKLFGLYDTLSKNIVTDIKSSEFDDFIKLAQKMKNTKIQSIVLDYGDKSANRAGFLINPSINEDFKNQWVLIPRIGNGNFSEIQKYIDCELKTGGCPIPTKPNYQFGI